MLNIDPKDQKILHDILGKYSYSLYAFGSRVKEKNRRFSDLDLFIADSGVDFFEMGDLQEELDESDISIEIDLKRYIDDMQPYFRELIIKDAVMIQANEEFLAAERNLFSKFTYLPKLLGYKIDSSDELTRIDTKLNTSMFNIVCDAKFKDEDITRKIDETIAQYNNQPFAWWVGPSTKPEMLGRKLDDRGFQRETEEFAMVADITDYQAPAQGNKIRIEHVNSIESLKDFTSVLAKYDESANEFFVTEEILKDAVKKKNPLFVAYVDNVPAGIGSMHFHANVAGIYDLITNEDLRGQGVGSSMMHHLMSYAKNMGIRKMCLSASSDSGYRIYERLGFKTVGLFHCFEWAGDK